MACGRRGAEDVSVDHGRAHVGVVKQFLDRTDVVAVLKKMRGGAAAEVVATRPLRSA